MASVKTIHDIVTPERLYPAGKIVEDMPQSLIDEMRPLGSIVDVVPETVAAPAAVAPVKISKKVE